MWLHLFLFGTGGTEAAEHPDLFRELKVSEFQFKLKVSKVLSFFFVILKCTLLFRLTANIVKSALCDAILNAYNNVM